MSQILRELVNLPKDYLRRYSWPKFNRTIADGTRPLLKRLPNYANAVLVAGCQRSGTTAVRRVITAADGFTNFTYTHDDELDAALILSGALHHDAHGRYCFQTTYLNDSYREYLSIPPTCQLIWVVRNPYSVVYSMAYHWRRFALNDLYRRCGIQARGRALTVDGNEVESSPAQRGAVRKACYSYAGKSSQVLELLTLAESGQLLVVDYDELCRVPDIVLPRVFHFIQEEFRPEYAAMINDHSVDKAQQLSSRERTLVTETCLATYEKVKKQAMWGELQ
jgi:hypothetical protein